MSLLSIDQVRPGDSYSEELTFGPETIASFISLTGDHARIHVDESFSWDRGFDNVVVHGFLLSVQFSRILGMELPGENTVIGSVELNFHAPVYAGETVKYTATVKRTVQPLGTVLLDLKIQKLDGTLCVDGKATCAFKQSSGR